MESTEYKGIAVDIWRQMIYIIWIIHSFNLFELDEKTHFVVYLKFVIGEAQAYLAYLKLYQELFHCFT